MSQSLFQNFEEDLSRQQNKGQLILSLIYSGLLMNISSNEALLFSINVANDLLTRYSLGEVIILNLERQTIAKRAIFCIWLQVGFQNNKSILNYIAVIVSTWWSMKLQHSSLHNSIDLSIDSALIEH